MRRTLSPAPSSPDSVEGGEANTSVPADQRYSVVPGSRGDNTIREIWYGRTFNMHHGLHDSAVEGKLNEESVSRIKSSEDSFDGPRFNTPLLHEVYHLGQRNRR